MPGKEIDIGPIIRRPTRQPTCDDKDVFDFGNQLMDDAKNQGWNQGIILCVKEDHAGKWLTRILARFNSSQTLSYAVEHMIQSLNDEFQRHGLNLEVRKRE